MARTAGMFDPGMKRAKSRKLHKGTEEDTKGQHFSPFFFADGAEGRESINRIESDLIKPMAAIRWRRSSKTPLR